MAGSLAPRTFLITGGSGFIGRAVIAALKSKVPTARIRTLDIRAVHDPQVESITGSVLDRTTLRNACGGVDTVIHLAAWLGVDATDSQPLKCLDINIEGTMRVLEAAAMAGVRKVILSSSSEVYGDPLELPIGESAPLHPKSVYAVTKLAAEEYVRGFGAQYGIAHTIIRFFNVYGPHQDLRFAIPRFVQSAIDGEAPHIFGDGTQTRAFCHVRDAADGLVGALMSPAADGEIFNIGNPAGLTSIIDLWRRIAGLHGSPDNAELVGFSAGSRDADREIQERCPDIGKARRILGFEPTVSLDAGLRTVLDYRCSLGTANAAA